MRIIVAGSRTFNNYPLLKKVLDKLTRRLKKLTIISGHAKGADKLGEQWALSNENTGRAVLEIYRAEWTKYGKQAGPIRNKEMLDAGANGLVVFWDGRSHGTKDVIQQARKKGLKRIKIVRFR